MEDVVKSPVAERLCTEVSLDRDLFSTEAVLKACYWLSRDFACEIAEASTQFIHVTIKARQDCSPETLASTKEGFLASVIDFALREKVEARTADIRDLLLAKAFSESGVLEDAPEGVFGDKVEEEKPQGIFRILSNSEL